MTECVGVFFVYAVVAIIIASAKTAWDVRSIKRLISARNEIRSRRRMIFLAEISFTQFKLAGCEAKQAMKKA